MSGLGKYTVAAAFSGGLTMMLMAVPAATVAASTAAVPATIAPDSNPPVVMQKIIGGTAQPFEQAPWQVAIVSDPANQFDSQFCGGTLIGPEWVLTAAHCFSKVSSVAPGWIVTGQSDLTETEGTVQRPILAWYIHEGYNDSTSNNDIALLKLDSAIDSADCPQCEYLAPLAADAAAGVYTEGTWARLSGWGSLDPAFETGANGRYPTLLQVADTTVTDCANTSNPGFASVITENMFCAGTFDGATYTVDTCNGDSGGPLVVDLEVGDYRLAGIVSWGVGCAMYTPGVYTKVSQYENWLAVLMGTQVDGEAPLDLEVIEEVASTESEVVVVSRKSGGGALGVGWLLLAGAFALWRQRLISKLL